MDGQNFDPKFGTVAQPQEVVKPLKTRDEFIQGLVANQQKPRPSGWFKVDNFQDEEETLAEQTGASEFAAGMIRPEYNQKQIQKVNQDQSDVDNKLVASSYNPTQDNKWLYGSNLSVTRYDGLRRAVGLKDGQSFTDYYATNKFVPAGYELDAKLLLREEKIKALETQMLEGKMGYDTFLYKAYGKDLLKMNGHDLSSSLYWYTRRKNGQYDNVKNNLAFMDQILRSAERSYLAEEWNRTSSGLKLNDIEGAIASDKPISPELMRDLFPQLFEALDGQVENDRKIMDLFMAGQIGPGMFRPYIDADGDGKIDYYLHTNGRLYSAKAEAEAGPNDAKVIYNDKGEVAEIYLPGAWSWDRGVTESALTQFAKIFYGVPELIGYVGAALVDVGEGVFGQGFDFSALGDFYTWSQKFQNGNELLSNQFYVQDGTLINSDGDVNYMNALRGISEGVGMITGMVTLAGVAGYLGKGAAAASNTFKGTKLSLDTARNFGYKFSQIKGFVPKTLYAIGSMANRVSMIKNGAPIFSSGANMWGMSAEAALYLAGRDFLNTAGELSSRQELSNLSTEDIFARTMEMTAVNAAITFTFRAVNDVGLTDRFAALTRGKQIANKTLTNLMDTGLGKAAVGHISKFTRFTPAINTLADMVENWATMAMNIGVSMNEEDYKPFESMANLVAGSKSMLNSPSAMAMQITQGIQTYRGSLGWNTRTGQATRDIIAAVQHTRGTMQGVENDFRAALIKATGNERTALERVYNKWLDMRQYVYDFKVKNDGTIEMGARKLDENGKPILTNDPDASDLASLLWLQRTMAGFTSLKDFDPYELNQGDLDIVSRNMKKTIEKYNIEKFVVKQSLIYGAYNSFMDKRQAKYDEWLKNPKSLRDTFNKGFKIYQAVESRLGKARSVTDYAGTNALSAPARQAFFESLQRVRTSNFRDAYLANDLALLDSSKEFSDQVAQDAELLEVSTLGGRFVLNNLTVEELSKIAEKKNNSLGKDKQTTLQNEKGFLIRYILTNLKTNELQDELRHLANDPNTQGSGDLLLKIKGDGGTSAQQKRRQEIMKVLDVLVYWEGKIKEANPNHVATIRKVGDSYVLRNQLENESYGLNIIDYVGSFLRGVTALKMQNLAGVDIIGFKTNAIANLMDRFDGAKAGTFLEAINKKDENAIKRVNDFLNLMVEKGVLSYEEAALGYDAKFNNDTIRSQENSVGRYIYLNETLADLVQRRGANQENIPDAKFKDDLTAFIEMLDKSSPQLRQALFKATGLTEQTLNNLRTGVLGGLADLKKTLGNLLGRRLQARLSQVAGSPGSLESLTDEEFLKLAIEEIDKARFGRTKGIPQEQLEEYVQLVFSNIPKNKADLADPKYAGLTDKEYETLYTLVSEIFAKDIVSLDSFFSGTEDEITTLLGRFNLTPEERKNVLTGIKNLKIDIVTEIATGQRVRTMAMQQPEKLGIELETIKQKVVEEPVLFDFKNPNPDKATRETIQTKDVKEQDVILLLVSDDKTGQAVEKPVVIIQKKGNGVVKQSGAPIYSIFYRVVGEKRIRQTTFYTDNEYKKSLEITRLLASRFETPDNEKTYLPIKDKIKIVEVEGKKIFQGVLDTRYYVLVEYNGKRIPFYLSSGEGGKEEAGVTAGRWYPFAGINPETGWINKFNAESIRNFYYSSSLRAISEYLSDIFPNLRETDSGEFRNNIQEAFNKGFKPQTMEDNSRENPELFIALIEEISKNDADIFGKPFVPNKNLLEKEIKPVMPVGTKQEVKEGKGEFTPFEVSNKQTQQVITEELKKLALEEYVNEEFERRTITENIDTKGWTFEQKLNYLLANDDFFIRNAGSNLPAGLDGTDEGSLLNLAKLYVENFINQSVETPASGKVFVSFGSFVGTARRKLFEYIKNAKQIGKDVDITLATSLELKQVANTLESLGVDQKDVAEFAQSLITEYNILNQYLSENPSGYIQFDLNTSEGRLALNTFLKAFGYNAGYEIYKHHLAEFGIYGVPPDGKINKSHRTFNLVTNGEYKWEDLLFIVKQKEAEYYKKQRETFAAIKESYVSKTNSLFRNVLFINEDTIITDTEKLILSTIIPPGSKTLEQLTTTIGQLVQGQRLKSGKAGGLSEAINTARQLLSVENQRDNKLYAFKLFRSLVDYLVAYRKDESKTRKRISLRMNTKEEIESYQKTGVWDVNFKELKESGKSYFIVDLVIKDLDEAGFTNALLKWIKSSPNNKVNFGVLVPATARGQQVSYTASDTTSEGDRPEIMQSSGTGDTPFSVLRKTLGYGIDILKLFSEEYSFDLQNFELTEESFRELSALKNKSVREIITTYKDSKNPFIRMAVNTLITGVELSKVYLNEVSARTPGVRKETVQLMMHPKIRRMFGTILEENPNLSASELALKLDQAYANEVDLSLGGQRPSISALEQYGVEAENDFVSAATVSSFLPKNILDQNYRFSEQEVQYFKDILDTEFLASSEELKTVYNPYSNIRNVLEFSNDTNINPTQQTLSRQGGQVIKFDVDALFAASDFELQELEMIIRSIQSNFRTPSFLIDKLAMIRRIRSSKSRLTQGPSKLQSFGAPSNTTERTIVAKQDAEGMASGDNFNEKVKAYADSFKRKASDTIGRQARYRINAIVNNPKMVEEQSWTKYLGNELSKLGESATIGQRLVLDLSKDENIGRYVYGITATAQAIYDLLVSKDSKFTGDKVAAKQKAFELAKNMMILSDGTDYVSMATKFLFVNRKTGEIINKAQLINNTDDPKYLNDFFRNLFASIEDDTDLLVIELNKNMMTGAGSLSDERFNYYLINKDNQAEFINLAYNNIKDQAKSMDDLKDLTDPQEVIFEVLSRTVTKKDYEAKFFDTFAKYLDQPNLPPAWKNIITNLVGNLFDTIFHNDGTYSTKELFEARDMGFEVLDPEKFEQLISNADRKISEIITFFVNEDSLPLGVKDLSDFISGEVDAYFANQKYINRFELKEKSKLELETFKFALDSAKKAKQNKKETIELANSRIEESIKKLENYSEQLLEIRNDLKNQNYLLKDNIEFSAGLRIQALNYFNKELVWVLKKADSIPDEEFKKILVLIRNGEASIGQLFYLNRLAFDLINKYTELATQDPKKQSIKTILSALRTFRSNFVYFTEDVISKELIAQQQKVREYLIKERNDLEKKRAELLESKLKAKEEKASVIEEKRNAVEKAEKNYIISLNGHRNFTEFSQELLDNLEIAKIAINDQRNILGVRSSLIDDFLRDQTKGKTIFNIIAIQADKLDVPGSLETKEEYLTNVFDEMVVKYLLKDNGSASINYRLFKLLKKKDGSYNQNVLINLFNRSKDDSIQKVFLDLLLNDVTNVDNKVNYMFDVEAFYNDKLTNPFSISLFKLRKISSVDFAKIRQSIADGKYKDNWDGFKQNVLSQLVESKKTFYIPVYGFDTARQRYVLIKNEIDLQRYYPEYVKKYLQGYQGARLEFNQYKDFILSGNFKDSLSVQEHKQLKQNYVGKIFAGEKIDVNQTRMIGFNNKKYDNNVLTEVVDEVSLINDKSIFANSLDIYNDIMREFSATSSGDRLSLDEQRKRYQLTQADAHASEDDLFFSLLVYLDQGGRLVDSNKNQTAVIRFIEKVRGSLGIQGPLTESDLIRIESKIEEILNFSNYSNDLLTKDDVRFINEYQKLFNQGPLELSRFQKELMETQVALFRQQEWKKNWKIMNDLKDVKPGIEELAKLASSEKFQNETGKVFDFLFDLVYKLVFDNTTPVAKDIGSKMKYVDNTSKKTVFDLVMRALSSFNTSNRSFNVDLNKEQIFLNTISQDAIALLKGIVAQFPQIEGLKDANLKTEDVVNNFETFKKNAIVPFADFKGTLKADSADDARASFQTSDESRKLIFSLLPLINQFADIEDTAVRNTLIQEMLTMITYNTDDQNIKGRMFGFGKNKPLTNINKVALREVLSSLAAENYTFKSMYLAAQGLNNRANPLKVYSLNNGRYTIGSEQIRNDSYYMSESKFRLMFDIDQRVDLDTAMKAVRREYGLSNDNQKLYISVLRQPSDKPNTIHNYELKVIADGQGIQSSITVDALRSNHSGDNDGDKMFIFKPTISQNRIANNVTKYQRASLNLIGDVLTDIEFNGVNVKRYNAKESFELIKLFDLSNRALRNRVFNDYTRITALPSKDKQIIEFNKRKEEVISILEQAGIKREEIEDNKILDYSWLQMHDVGETMDIGKGLLFTTKNFQVPQKEWAIFNQNMVALSAYIFKNKLSEIDSVTGLYDFVESKEIAIKAKNSGFAKLFETTGVHLTEESLMFIKDNASQVIEGLIKRIGVDPFLNKVYLNKAFDVESKGRSALAKDYLIRSLQRLQQNINRDDIATLIIGVVDAYDTMVKSSDDYNNILFALATDEKFAIEAEETRQVSAAEKRQIAAIKDLYFSIGIDLEEKGKNGNLSFLENIHDLLEFAVTDKSLDAQVRFSNPNLSVASRLVLNEIVNESQRKRNVALYKNKLGPKGWNNFSGTKTIYVREGFKGTILNPDLTYTLNDSRNVLVFDMYNSFYDKNNLDVVNKLSELEQRKVFVVPKGGLKIDDKTTIPEGQKIMIVATSKTDPDFFEEVDSEDRPFVVIGYVNNLNDADVINNYKINVPGSSKQKSTLLPFDYQNVPKGFQKFTDEQNIHFLSFASEDTIKKANMFSESVFKYYDKNFNEVTAKDDFAYIVEESNIALPENTTNWRSNSPSFRTLDGPSIINNIGNPEAIFYFGRINKILKVNVNDKEEITVEINTKELKETKDYMRRLKLNDVQENNGLRLMHLMMVKTIIYNPALNLSNEEKTRVMQSFFSNTNLNNIEGYQDVLRLFMSYYGKSKELKANWNEYINKNPYFKKLFSKELHEKIFPYGITKITAPDTDSQISPSKQNPVEQAVASGFVKATGELVSLRSDVKEYDNVKQIGQNFYIDGYAYVGILDLLNNLVGAKKGNQRITRATINALAPYLGARKILGNTFTSQYLPILTTDAKRGNTTQAYAGINSAKQGSGTTKNKSEILLQSKTPGFLPVEPKEKNRDMYANDIFTIDEEFLSRILKGISYDENKKQYVFDKSFEIGSDSREKFIKKMFIDLFRDAKNYDQRLDFLAQNYTKFALQFDLKTLVDEDGNIRVSLNRVKRSGTIDKLSETLKNVLGSASYFDAVESNKERIKANVERANRIIESKLPISLAEVQNKSNNSKEFSIVFDEFIKTRNKLLSNKTKAREAFLAAYKADLSFAEREDLAQLDFFQNIFTLKSAYDESAKRDEHTIKIGPNRKQTLYVDRNVDEQDVIKLDKLKLTSSGISEEDQRSFEVSQIVTILKKEPQQLQGYFLSRINKIKDLAYRFGIEGEINEYMWIKGNVYKLLLLQQELSKTTDSEKRVVLEDQINSSLVRLNVKSVKELNDKAKNFESIYGDVASDIQKVTTDIYNAQNITTRNSNEPIPDIYWLILPTIKAGTGNSEFEFAKNLVLNPKERLLSDDGHASYAGYNYFRSIETTVYNLSRHIAAENFSARAINKGVLTNLPIVNFVTQKIWSFITSEEGRRAIDKIESKNWQYKTFETFQNTMKGVLKFANTDLENIFIDAKVWEKKNIVEVYLELKTNIDKFIANNNGMTLSEAQATMKREKPESLVYNKAFDIYNLHEFSNDILAKINELIGGDVLTKYLFNELDSFARSKGLSLADKYGRKFNRNMANTKRLSEMSMEWISDALNFNIKELGGYEKNMITKALSGDVYLMDTKLQEHLDKYFYTVKVPNKFGKAIRKLQSLATALIMSNPFKILDRILKYSLTDLTMMSLANPKTMFKVNESRKDLSAFMQSKGAVVSERLQQYLKTQGVDLTKTNFDYVLNDFNDYEKKGTFFKKYFDVLGKPFEFQTQLVRYAYWLQTVEDLDKKKTNVYGSSYYKKNLVDGIQDSFDAQGRLINKANENKAAYLMSQQLGAPGDFPLLAKDLNGIFMFTTFPLALVRWAKGEANSMATAVKNLFVEGEQKQALSWLATQGGGVLGSALFVQAIIMMLANLFNVDDETEEEWSRQQALPDVFATLIQGAPVFDVYNTADPIKLLSELTYAPFVEAAEERRQDAIYGKPDDGNLTRGNGLAKWAFQNILGKINPAFKDPIEVVLGISSLGDSVYLQDGPGYENFIRKMSAYIFGGSGSRALGRFIGELDPTETIDINTVFNGLSKVIGAELGNTKAYKADVKNYYRVLSNLKGYNYMLNSSRDFGNVSNTSFDSDRYDTLKTKIRKLFNNKSDFSKVYEVVIDHLETGGNLQEVRSALNNVSIQGQLSRMPDMEAFLETLDDKERFELEKAIMYEEENFPWINQFRESVRQNIEKQYYGQGNYVPRYYQPYYKMYNDSRNIYYKPYYSRYLQNPFSAYRSAWYTVNQIPPKEKK